jgi:hypothetical protein
LIARIGYPGTGATPIVLENPSSETPVSNYRVVAIPDAIANRVRETRRSPGYGHPVHSEVATGHGPCRLCLRAFRIGTDRRLLFTYDAFRGHEPMPLPGPIFIHESACERHPEDAGFPTDLLRRNLTLNAYARGRKLVNVRYIADGEPDAAIGDLLSQRAIDYIHVRDTEAGCYDFRIERVVTQA